MSKTDMMSSNTKKITAAAVEKALKTIKLHVYLRWINTRGYLKASPPLLNFLTLPACENYNMMEIQIICTMSDLNYSVVIKGNLLVCTMLSSFAATTATTPRQNAAIAPSTKVK